VANGDDCDDHDPNNWTSCATCVDEDLDTYFVGCDDYITIDGPDCFDRNPACTLSCDRSCCIWVEGTLTDWQSIAETGTATWLRDDAIGPTVDLEFTFDYYFDNTYTTSTLAANGYIYVGSTTDTYSSTNGTIPSTDSPNGILAGFWNDLNPDPGSGSDPSPIYYDTIGDPGNREFVVQWDDVQFFGASERTTFQIVVREDGGIVYNYLDIPETGTYADGSRATVGVETESGTEALPWSVQGSTPITSGTRLELLCPVGI
jgi:hypothetical protein